MTNLKASSGQIDQSGDFNFTGDFKVKDSPIVVSVSSIKNLVVPTVTGQSFSVTGFYSGTTVGGGEFIWDASKDKALHNGGTIIAPEAIAAWDGSQVNLTALLNWTGAGAGCWVRDTKIITIEDFGATENSGDCAPSINKALIYSGLSGKAVYAYGKEYNHSGVDLPSDSKLVGSGKYLTTFKLIDGSNRPSFALLSPLEIRMTLAGFNVYGNKENNAANSHGISLISQVGTSGDLAVRPTIEDVLVSHNNGIGLQLEGASGFATFTRAFVTNCIARENVQHGFRFRRMTDSTLLGMFASANSDYGYYVDNCANNKFNALKSAYNVSGGWVNTGGRRNTFIQCEAQEDYIRGVSFYGEEDSSADFVLDANGRVGSEGLGGRFQLCKRCTFDLRSMSFQVPTWQSTGIQLNSNETCIFNFQNDNSTVATPIDIQGTTNNEVYIHQTSSINKLVSGSSELKEVGDLSYVQSSFLPSIEFDVQGDNSVVYNTRKGYYTKSMGKVDVFVQIIATVTHSTASGILKISGLPNLASNKLNLYTGSFSGSGVDVGITGLTQVNPIIINNQQYIRLVATKSGATYQTVGASNVTSGSTVNIGLFISYLL